MKTIAKTGIQILSERTIVNLSTLNLVTALQIHAAHATGLLRSFLMKKIQYNVHLKAVTSGEGHLIFGMARGDASVTEIKAALENAQLEDDRKTQAAKRDVLFETVRSFVMDGTGVNGMLVETISGLGGGNGIPFEEGDGWQTFVYNPDDGALTTGAQILGVVSYWGVWL